MARRGRGVHDGGAGGAETWATRAPTSVGRVGLTTHSIRASHQISTLTIASIATSSFGSVCPVLPLLGLKLSRARPRSSVWATMS